MASRMRNRQAPLKNDADEERHMWNNLRADAKRVDSLLAEHQTKWNRMVEIRDELEQQHAKGEEPKAELENELAKLTRENIKLCEDIQSSLKGASDGDNSILSSLDILKALRQSSENDPVSSVPPPRAAATAKASRIAKRKADAAAAAGSQAGSVADDKDSLAPDSPAGPGPGPSPKVMVPGNRLKAISRSGSVPTTREPSVKVEDVDSGADLPKPEKLRFVRGAEVFYRTKKGSQRAQDRDDQGEGILCTITTVVGEGKHRKFEILDVEPDEGALPYKAAPSQMVPIPSANEGLVDPSPKKTVLAMYPGTTTFYRAEVVAVKGKDLPSGHVRLRFEDEEEKNKEQEVERRYVLLQWPGS